MITARSTIQSYEAYRAYQAYQALGFEYDHHRASVERVIAAPARRFPSM
jgi:hypothetical protein